MLNISLESTAPAENLEIMQTRHRVKRNDFRLGNGATVSVEYWADPTSVSVAAYDMDGHQASTAIYQASAGVGNLSPELQAALIDSMANALEYDLINKPELCIQKQMAQQND